MIIYDLLVRFSNWVWGLPMLIWLVGGGIILTISVDFVQFKKFGYIMKKTLGTVLKQEAKEGKITGYQALTAALASTIGTGNIIGVGVAIAMGGPGAIFWMWIIGFIAMGIKYSEIIASIKFREEKGNGEYSAGPYMYISKGLNNKVLAVIWAICMIIGLLLAASVHTGAIVDTLETINIPRVPATITCMIVVAIIIYGGIQRLVKFTERMVPIMSVIYIFSILLIMILNVSSILPAIKLIFTYAFKPISVMGGFAGSILSNTIRWGISRGMYSSDAGNGVPSIMHGQADVEHSVEQGIWGVFEVFFDTIVVCTFSALAVLVSGSWMKYGQEAGATLVAYSFTDTLGVIGSIIIVLTTVLFAITTVISIAYFLESQISTMLGDIMGKVFQGIYILLMFIGGTYGVTKLLFLADVGNAFTILINMSSLVILRKVLKKETEEYFENVEENLTK